MACLWKGAAHSLAGSCQWVSPIPEMLDDLAALATPSLPDWGRDFACLHPSFHRSAQLPFGAA